MATVYLGLGSNLGDRLGLLRAALIQLAQLGEPPVPSAVYETEPWGDPHQPRFLNLACRLNTRLVPERLLAETQAIERRLGRRPTRRWGPRLIDIDLLTYDDLRLDSPALTLPHPRIAERSFVLVPLADLAPGLRLPGHHASILALIARLPETDPPPRRVATATEIDPYAADCVSGAKAACRPNLA